MQARRGHSKLNCYLMANVVSYMKSNFNDIFRVMCTCKKFQNINFYLKRNPCPVEVLSLELKKGKITAYSLFKHIETLDVYSYRDLYKIYCQISKRMSDANRENDRSSEVSENGNTPYSFNFFETAIKSNPIDLDDNSDGDDDSSDDEVDDEYYKLYNVYKLTDKDEYNTICWLNQRTLELENSDMNPIIKNERIRENHEEIIRRFKDFKSVVDSNGINLQMIIDEYKKYFPRLTNVTIQLKKVDLSTDKKVYLKLMNFIDLYSKKLNWNRDFDIYNTINHQITEEQVVEEKEFVDAMIRKAGQEDGSLSEYNLEDALKSEEEIPVIEREDPVTPEEDEEDGPEEEEDDDFPEEDVNLLGGLYRMVINNGMPVYVLNNDAQEQPEPEQEHDQQNAVVANSAQEILNVREYPTLIPKKWEIIPNKVFRKNMLKELVIPESIKCIGDQCFEDCVDLERIRIPSSVEYLGIKCFRRCIELREIEIERGSQMKWIGNGCFKGCISISRIELPIGLREIGDSCFEGCVKLNNVRIPWTLKKINKWTFKGCSNMFKIHIPRGINWIRGDDPFDQTPYKLFKLMKRLGMK